MNHPMIRLRLLLFFLLFYPSFLIFCQGQDLKTIVGSIYSNILDQKVDYSVLLPENYENSDSSNYSTIYLLHGINGDHMSWIQRSKINILIDSLIETGDIGECIYIMPSAYNSYYINNHDNSFRYMDFFTREFIPAVDSIYRTKENQENRALLGLYMGGFGSIILGLKHPDMFGSIISFSAAVRTDSIFKALPQAKYNAYFGKVFGFDLLPDERITDHWKANSPYYISDTALLAKARSQNWYIDCGLDDFLYPANKAFNQWLGEKKIPHEYLTRPGSHNWNYWYQSTVKGLMYLNEKLYSFPIPPGNS